MRPRSLWEFIREQNREQSAKNWGKSRIFTRKTFTVNSCLVHQFPYRILAEHSFQGAFPTNLLLSTLRAPV